jgi:hypothetical protein
MFTAYLWLSKVSMNYNVYCMLTLLHTCG